MEQPSRKIFMLAAENDALRRGKVGGLGDVVRDLPVALADLGCSVTVLTPSHGFLHKQNPSAKISDIEFPFRGKRERAGVYRLTPKVPYPGITHLAVDHEELLGDPIYFNDSPATPFRRDAEKYAAFCAAAGKFLTHIEGAYALHLHDWHTGVLYLLRDRHPEFSALRKTKTLFTVHNVALQGTRPFRGDSSTLSEWFPELFDTGAWVDGWRDPRWKDACFNPMLAGIRRAENVNTVSPGYAEEILKTSDHDGGFYGGEGLEAALTDRKKERSLFGILNGCEYPARDNTSRISPAQLINVVHSACNRNPPAFGEETAERLASLSALRPKFVLTAVTRVVEQKARLFFEPGRSGVNALESIAGLLEEMNGVFIMIGSGDPSYESRFGEATERHQRFIFIRGYSESVSNALYAGGTLFLMPSLFEPCGISQMIAMREGQPCVVHAVGGLKDTVADGINGFTFSGTSFAEQVDAFVGATRKAAEIFLKDQARWGEIQDEALNARFTWETSAQKYLELLS